MTYSLTSTGTVRSEYTIVRKSQNEFYLISAGALTDYDKDYLIKNAEDKEKAKKIQWGDTLKAAR